MLKAFLFWIYYPLLWMGFIEAPSPELRYRIIISPIAGKSMKDYSAAAKKIWSSQKAEAQDLVNAWLTHIRGCAWHEAVRTFTFSGLTKEEIVDLAARVRKSDSFEVLYNQYELIKDQSEEEQRRETKGGRIGERNERWLVEDAAMHLHNQGALETWQAQYSAEG